MQGITTRVVTVDECLWLHEDISADTVVYKYTDHTYGCISSSGVAVTFKEGVEPFMELPKDAIKWNQ